MEKKFNINNIEIELKKDYAILQDVDLVFNSASGLLLMRTGTAKAIREHSEKLTETEEQEYFKILDSFENPIMKKYIESFGVKEWKPREAQLSSFKRILENNGPYNTGDIIIDKDWSKKEPKQVLHIVGMTYHLKEDGELDVDKVSEESLTKVLTKAFEYAEKNNYKKVSTPILCTRGNYGLAPKISLRAILNAIKNINPKNIEKAIICFESEGPQETFDSLTEEELKEMVK